MDSASSMRNNKLIKNGTRKLVDVACTPEHYAAAMTRRQWRIIPCRFEVDVSRSSIYYVWHTVAFVLEVGQ